MVEIFLKSPNVIQYPFCWRLLRPANVTFSIIQENYQSFYPSEPFSLAHFKMRHPVIQFHKIISFKTCLLAHCAFNSGVLVCILWRCKIANFNNINHAKYVLLCHHYTHLVHLFVKNDTVMEQTCNILSPNYWILNDIQSPR